MSFNDTFFPILGAGCGAFLCWVLFAIIRFVILPLVAYVTKAK